jgi:hypothetical protein
VEFDHHPGANSFKAALKMTCYFCSFAWNKKECSLSWQESISCGTIGLVRVQIDSEKCIQFRCEISKYETYELASQISEPSILHNTRAMSGRVPAVCVCSDPIVPIVHLSPLTSPELPQYESLTQRRTHCLAYCELLLRNYNSYNSCSHLT